MPAPGTGLIDVYEFNQGLARVANAGLDASRSMTMLINGLHSNPMRGLIPNGGQSSAWTSGDWGNQTHSPYNAKEWNAEVGFGYRVNEQLQFNIAGGYVGSRADTGLGGITKTQAGYVMPEAIVRLSQTPLYTTITALYASGRSDIDRAYLNAGVRTSASGKPDTQSWGARVRLDWMNAATLGKVALTPYTSLTYLNTHLDGYTEKDGAFPVRWDARTTDSTTAHLGLDATWRATERLTILGRMTYAHRFEKRDVAASGNLIGLYDFRFPGLALKRDWLQWGLGVETDITPKSKASFMVNVTTQGQAPTYWGSFNYRYLF